MRERILPWEAVGVGSLVLVNGEHPCRTLPSRRELAAAGLSLPEVLERTIGEAVER